MDRQRRRTDQQARAEHVGACAVAVHHSLDELRSEVRTFSLAEHR